MARPRKTEGTTVPQAQTTPATERESAPETVATVAPPVYQGPPGPSQMRVSRSNSKGVPRVRHHPEVRGGTCEYCGVIDSHYPAADQYKLCPHYRGQQLWCNYCPEDKDPNDVIYHSVLHIVDHPYQPNTLLCVCDNTECMRKFHAEFSPSSR